jgi:hypothetical protein
MTCPAPDHTRSTFDLPFETANERITVLQQETTRSRMAASRHGLVERARDGLGRGLISLGSAIRPASAVRGRPAVSR